MALRGEIHDHVGRKFVDRPGHRRVIANVRAKKREFRVVGDRRERVPIAGVGQLVHDENVAAVPLHGHPCDRRTDEPSAAGDEKTQFRLLIIPLALWRSAAASRSLYPKNSLLR